MSIVNTAVHPRNPSVDIKINAFYRCFEPGESSGAIRYQTITRAGKRSANGNRHFKGDNQYCAMCCEDKYRDVRKEVKNKNFGGETDERFAP